MTIKGHYGYSTTIEFAENETVETASIGDSVAWQVIKPESRPNMLFIKPLEANANTNMTVVTNLRIYSFELSADKAPSRQDKNLAFRIRFTYPNTDAQGLAGIGGDGQPSAGLLTQGKSPDEWNFDYSFSGSRSLRPLRAFDDGKFTYLQFSKRETTPAIFLVDAPNGTARFYLSPTSEGAPPPFLHTHIVSRFCRGNAVSIRAHQFPATAFPSRPDGWSLRL